MSGWSSTWEVKETSGSSTTEQGSQSVKDSIYSLSCPPEYGELIPETGEWHMFGNNPLCFLSPLNSHGNSGLNGGREVVSGQRMEG